MQTKYHVPSINQKKVLRTPKASVPDITWEETSQRRLAQDLPMWDSLSWLSGDRHGAQQALFIEKQMHTEQWGDD